MKKTKAYISQKNGMEMLTLKADISFEQDKETENHVISLYPDVQYQEILGFGGAFTETSAFNYSKMSPGQQKKIVDAYFNKETGLGYNFCRTHIHSCDFAIDRYTYTDDGDVSLDSFSVDRDRKYILPFIKAANQTAKDLYLFASPWSPPGWMKDTGELCCGGKLKQEYAECWARYMVKYLEEYKKEGISFFGITVQNEAKAWQTWESCQYTAEEEAEFVVKYLKPALEKSGFGDVRIMIWDHNKERIYDRSCDSFSVPGAKEAVWGIAFHWYSGDHFEALDMTYNAFPDKPLILSEFCLGGARGETAKGPHSSWDGVEIYASEIIGDFNHFMAASVDWNMIVDEDGGPYHDRPRGCKAQIVVDPEKDSFILEPTYYTVAHFSKFVERGARRIGCSSFSEKMKAVAFKNPNGNVIVVVLNCTEKADEISLKIADDMAKVTMPAKSLATFIIE